MKLVVHWSFRDYLEGGNDPVEDWYRDELSDAGKFQFDSLLKDVCKTENHLHWVGFKYLKGEPKKHRIWQLDFLADGRQYRVLGVFGDVRRQAVLLLGCYHKGQIYTPPSAIKTACRRARLVNSRKAITIGRAIKFDL